jgi:hypothetical protein
MHERIVVVQIPFYPVALAVPPPIVFKAPRCVVLNDHTTSKKIRAADVIQAPLPPASPSL